MKKGMLALVLCLSACGGDDPLPTISVQDVGDVCEALAIPMCERANECASDPGCELGFMKACCIDDGTCDWDTDATEQNIAECIDAWDMTSCPNIEAGNLPAECLNL